MLGTHFLFMKYIIFKTNNMLKNIFIADFDQNDKKKNQNMCYVINNLNLITKTSWYI